MTTTIIFHNASDGAKRRCEEAQRRRLWLQQQQQRRLQRHNAGQRRPKPSSTWYTRTVYRAANYVLYLHFCLFNVCCLFDENDRCLWKMLFPLNVTALRPFSLAVFFFFQLTPEIFIFIPKLVKTRFFLIHPIRFFFTRQTQLNKHWKYSSRRLLLYLNFCFFVWKKNCDKFCVRSDLIALHLPDVCHYAREFLPAQGR